MSISGVFSSNLLIPMGQPVQIGADLQTDYYMNYYTVQPSAMGWRSTSCAAFVGRSGQLCDAIAIRPLASRVNRL
jgi:hypothetical protein